MRRVMLAVTAILLMSVLVMAQTTAAPAPGTTKPMPTATAAGTTGDTGDMQSAMNRIAADQTLRLEMVKSLITVARTDSAFRHQMVGAMMADKEVHMTMVHMQNGEKGSMRKHEGGMEGMHGEKKPSTTTPTTAPKPMPGK